MTPSPPLHWGFQTTEHAYRHAEACNVSLKDYAGKQSFSTWSVIVQKYYCKFRIICGDMVKKNQPVDRLF